MDKWNEAKSDTQHKLNESFEKAKDTISDVYYDVKESTESGTEQLKEKASQLYEGTKEQLKSVEATMEEYTGELVEKVKENPLKALLIAGGIGFILSHLLKK